MSIRVVFWGSAQSVFSNRHYEALAKVPCQLAAVIDTPASREGSTNPLVTGFFNFVDHAREKTFPFCRPITLVTPVLSKRLMRFPQISS
jgi:hypothetical protein